MSNITKKFDSLLEAFVKSTATSMEAARDLAIMCIQVFEDNGDLSYAQKFLEAMPKNYIRRQAFLKWLCDFAPVTMDGSTLVKDKSKDANEFKVAEAIVVSFWDYAPEPETINYGANDVVVAIQRTIAKFSKTTKEGKERYHAASDKAKTALVLARDMVADLASTINDNRTDQEKQEDEQVAASTEDVVSAEDDHGIADPALVAAGA